MRSRENIPRLAMVTFLAIGLGSAALGCTSSETSEPDSTCGALTAATFSELPDSKAIKLVNISGCVAIQEIGGDETIGRVKPGDPLVGVCTVNETLVVKLDRDGSELIGRVSVSPEAAHKIATASALPDCRLLNVV